jgi:uncharacterized membrane protein YheB (UPF0754 family)
MTMPDTLTLEQVEYLRRTLPQKSMSDIMPKVDVDAIIQTQVKTINGQEVFVPLENSEE